MTYFIITGSEDGGCRVCQVSRDELIRRLTPDENGESFYGNWKIAKQIPKVFDDSLNEIVIIKGELVVPKEVSVVKKYEIE